MSATLRKPMSREEFFEWAEAQDERYEFDGEQPVLMNGGLVGHNRLQRRLAAMLQARLSGQHFEVLGPNDGVGTTGKRVRYPDALVSRGFTTWTERLVANVVAVFEVASPSTSRVDQVMKLREYGAVETIRSYAIFETESPAVTAFEKQATASGSRRRSRPMTASSCRRSGSNSPSRSFMPAYSRRGAAKPWLPRPASC